MATQTQEAAYRSASASTDRRPRGVNLSRKRLNEARREAIGRPRDRNLRTAIHCHPVTCAPDGVPCRLLIDPIPWRHFTSGCQLHRFAPLETWRVVVALLLKETLYAGYHKHQKRSRDSNAIER